MIETDADRRKKFREELKRQITRPAAIQTEAHATIARLLDTAGERIAAALAAGPSTYESWRLGALRDRISSLFTLFERDATAVLTTGLDRSWEAGSDLIVEPLRAAEIRLGGLLPALDPRLLDALKVFQVDRIRDIAATTASRIGVEIAQAAIGTQTPWDAASKVATLLEAPKSRAFMIVRTELGTAYSEAGQQRMEQAVAAGVKGLAKQWRRSGKLHPRLTHELADGQIVDVDKPFIVGGIEIPKPRDPSIPASERINCGCASLPYMRHWRVTTPGARAYTAEELAASPTKREADQIRRSEPGSA